MAPLPLSRPVRSPFWRVAPPLLFVGGACLAVVPLAQNGFAWWNQRQLRAQWDASAVSAPSGKGQASPKTQSGNAQPQAAAPISAPVSRADWPPTRIVIPSLALDEVVVDGTDGVSLRRGPGHQPGTALPGEVGNCVIAGHRNVYGSPFARINEMGIGDVIELKMPHRTVRYNVVGQFSANDSDTSVLRPSPADRPPRLTLITCTVPHSWQRIVLVAEDVE